MTRLILKKKRKERYPFSKLRVYFNAVTGFLALALSLWLLGGFSTALIVASYIILVTAITVLSLELKLYLLRRMEESESEQNNPEGDEDRPRSFLNWRLIGTVAVLVVVLLLPVVTAVLVDPVWWFVCFSSFVVGFSISEVFLYLATEH